MSEQSDLKLGRQRMALTAAVLAAAVVACDTGSDLAATTSQVTQPTLGLSAQSAEEQLREAAQEVGPDPAVLATNSLHLCRSHTSRYAVTSIYCDTSGHRILEMSVGLPLEVVDPDADLSSDPIPDSVEVVLLLDGTTAYYEDESAELDNEATGEIHTGVFARVTRIGWEDSSGFYIKLTSERIFDVHEPLGRDEMLALANSVAGRWSLEGIGSEG